MGAGLTACPPIFEVFMRSRRSGQGHRLKRKDIRDAKAEGKSLKKFRKDKKDKKDK